MGRRGASNLAGGIVVQSTSRCEYAHAAAKLLCTCYTQQTSEKTKRSKLQLVNPSLEYLRARLTTINNAAGITRELSAPVCEAMVGMHAYTGCDTTSAFSGRGKKLAFQLITKQTPKASWLERLWQHSVHHLTHYQLTFSPASSSSLAVYMYTASTPPHLSTKCDTRCSALARRNPAPFLLAMMRCASMLQEQITRPVSGTVLWKLPRMSHHRIALVKGGPLILAVVWKWTGSAWHQHHRA